MNILEVTQQDTVTLQDLYGGNYPDDTELFWQFVTPGDLTVPLTIERLSSHKIKSIFEIQYHVDDIEDLLFRLRDEQKETLAQYRASTQLANSIVIIAAGKIIDGNHRALAAALNNMSIRAVDLSELDETRTDEMLNELNFNKSVQYTRDAKPKSPMISDEISFTAEIPINDVITDKLNVVFDVYNVYKKEKALEISFSVNDDWEPTGRGNFVLILSTVKSIVSNELPKILNADQQIVRLVFTAARDQSGRVKHYRNTVVPFITTLLNKTNNTGGWVYSEDNKSELHNIRFVWEKNAQQIPVDEMAMKSYTPLGDFSAPGPFKDPDYKLVVHPTHIKKVESFFKNTNQDFRFFVSNLPKLRKYRESGEATAEELEKIFGPKISQQILQGSDEAITVVFMGNYGLNRVMMTPWTMAHRIGHAIAASDGYGTNTQRSIPEWPRLRDEFRKSTEKILSTYYGVYSSIMPYGRYSYIEDAKRALYYGLGTTKSSRERNLNTSTEFIYEQLALFILKGTVVLNPLPVSVGYGRVVGWKNKSYEKYLNIKSEFRDEPARQQASQKLAHELNGLLNDFLWAAVGRVFIM